MSKEKANSQFPSQFLSFSICPKDKEAQIRMGGLLTSIEQREKNEQLAVLMHGCFVLFFMRGICV